MDTSDYNTPIKTYFDDRNMFYLMPSYTKTAKVYLKLSESYTDDDYMRIQSPKTQRFFELETTMGDIKPTETNSLIQIGLLLSPYRDRYERKVFTIFDFFGTIGGFYGLMETF